MSHATQSNGTVVTVRGVVIDVAFDCPELPQLDEG
jgi:hypothetical protein